MSKFSDYVGDYRIEPVAITDKISFNKVMVRASAEAISPEELMAKFLEFYKDSLAKPLSKEGYVEEAICYFIKEGYINTDDAGRLTHTSKLEDWASANDVSFEDTNLIDMVVNHFVKEGYLKDTGVLAKDGTNILEITFDGMVKVSEITKCVYPSKED